MARKKGNRKVVQQSEFSDEEDFKSGASLNRWETADDVELDSEDEFHKQREMIDLGDDYNENESEEEEEGNEEVFGLDGVSSDEDDDDEEADLGIYKVQNNDDIIEKQKYKELDEKAWGKRRDIYYNADDADADDEIAKEEEIEALRLQKERIEQLDEEDFLDDSFATQLSTGKSGIDVDLEGEEEEEEEEDEEQVELANKKLKENISKMSKDEQLSIIFNQTPEMLELIEDYKEKLIELKEKIIPILNMIEKDEIRNSLEKKTVKYLKFKYKIIVSYLTNISFYLVLRSSNSANKIKEHPVISTLVDIKLILDKIEKEVEGKEEEKKSKKNKKNRKPKEKTIIAQMIDELNRQVTEGRPKDDSQDISSKLLAEVHDEFSNDDDNDEEYGEEEEEENDKDEIEEEQENDEEEQLSSILSTDMNKKKKKNQKHVQISEEVQAYSDSDYEERFISLKSDDNKKLKKNKKEKKSEDFNEARVNEDDDEINENDKKKNSLRFYASNINKSLTKLTGRKSTGDLDVPYKRKDKKEISEEVKKSRENPDADIFDDTDDLDLNDGLDLNSNLRSNKRPREDDEEDYIDNDYVDNFNEEDLQYYEDLSNASKEKKRVKEENFRKIKQELLEESMIDENDLAPGEKRHINKTIEKNRGLTPHRKREKKNPRVKHRKKYEKAMIKLKSFRRVAYNKNDVGPYAGETTGIKTKLSRSVRFTN
ncbi:hypothetical protein BCR32DRAFT_264819 [Anaeromyces robustus]|uniref:Sas10 C-terminal domain-containing protein n=1 Tax=Anaeromyces robustus TaxID=1754192 RepID=A0A1Y1XLN0_9FUNG|nr:hypothetical protein BCR32DRAFT_264819 [Anaeromyces robustus]|eukprot:ORX86659.1 hypothetical protein BCR32DRAFT_264819 [Anaeromyces robustus]